MELKYQNILFHFSYELCPHFTQECIYAPATPWPPHTSASFLNLPRHLMPHHIEVTGSCISSPVWCLPTFSNFSASPLLSHSSPLVSNFYRLNSSTWLLFTLPTIHLCLASLTSLTSHLNSLRINQLPPFTSQCLFPFQHRLSLSLSLSLFQPSLLFSLFSLPSSPVSPHILALFIRCLSTRLPCLRLTSPSFCCFSNFSLLSSHYLSQPYFSSPLLTSILLSSPALTSRLPSHSTGAGVLQGGVGG